MVTYRYGKLGTPGNGPNRLWNPDDAIMLPGGSILTADIKNQRILLIAKGRHHPAQVWGDPTRGYHDPPRAYGAPNGAFPMGDGRFLVTEICGDWVDAVTRVIVVNPRTNKIVWQYGHTRGAGK